MRSDETFSFGKTFLETMTDPSRQPPAVVALTVHPHRPVALELASKVAAWWEGRGVQVLIDADALDPDRILFDPAIDVAMSLGGDGTMLRTVALAARGEIPVLGVNLGNLGYLTSVEPDEILAACELLASGSFEVEDRMMLDVLIMRADHSSDPQQVVAMNEVVVEKTSDGHTICLGVKIGGARFLTYAADGMLVATPTGSTAYNLSLRGPIVSPKIKALVMTPIAPHMLFDRALIIEPDLPITLEVMRDREAVVVVDGERIAELVPGDQIEVRASDSSAKMVRFGERGFYEILHSKFGLLDR
jgi:NAD+ kinase